MSYTVKRCKARKDHKCAGEGGHTIHAGDVYLVHKEFPGGDAGYADSAGHPVTMAECAHCADRYGRAHMLEPLPEEQAHRIYLKAIQSGRG